MNSVQYDRCIKFADYLDTIESGFDIRYYVNFTNKYIKHTTANSVATTLRRIANENFND